MSDSTNLADLLALNLHNFEDEVHVHVVACVFFWCVCNIYVLCVVYAFVDYICSVQLLVSPRVSVPLYYMDMYVYDCLCLCSYAHVHVLCL